MVRKSLMLVALIAACQPSTPKIPEAPESIAGRVTMVKESGDGIGTVRVEALPGDATGSAKAVVRITKATAVVGAPAGTADFGALRPGQWVRVWFLGPVRESYPVQANAGTIVIDSIGTNTLQGPPPARADSIVLERSICYGTCPAYRLRLSDTGEIRFESRTEADRTAADTVAATALPSLISKARAAGVFELPPEIAADSVLCHNKATDHPTVVVTIFTSGGTKRVEDYHGCFETVEHEVLPPIARLRSFEVEIDSVLRSSRWVRPANRQP